MAFKKVAKRAELGVGKIKVVKLGDREVAIFNVEGTLYAVDNVCPHRLGPLGEGFLEGGVVSCPWHGWRYDVRTGQGITHSTSRLSTFQVELRGEDVFVAVEESRVEG